MLSIEQLNDERASENLPVPDLDLPKFSLRDYVFNARSKDIRNNWPFSLKNLQLCLKHGVKDLLPPFHTPDFVRNRPITECVGGSSTSEVPNICIFDGDVSGTKENEVVNTLDEGELEEKRVQTCIQSSSCRCEGENGFSSIMTSDPQPQLEPVSTSGPSTSSVKTDNILENPVEVGISGLPASQKTESKIKTSGKRCKLVRKSNNQLDQTSAADIATSFTAISESMASKICPVCKTFSSSSNTTLNAHIDQCLSMESAPKCMSDSKLARFRIKPRKTKLMVDIYATARMCTLEELDRRNGTTWAALSCFPAQDIAKCQTNTGGKKQKVVPVHPEDIDDAGAVYIDANGTKLRILSKFNSPPSLPKVHDGLGSRKFKGLKGRKFHSVKKNKYHASKHHKYLKVAAQIRKVSSRKGISSQIREGHNHGNGSNDLEVHKIKKQLKPHDAGTLRRWACSKRTRLGKVNRREGYQPSTFKWHASQGMIVDTDQSVLAESFTERSHVQDETNFSEIGASSPESSERNDKILYEAHLPDKRGWSHVRKSLRSSFSGEMIGGGTTKQMKKIFNHLSKGSSFVGNNCLLKPKIARVQTIKDYQQSDVPPGFNNKSARNWHINALKATKLSSSQRKEILVSSRSSITGSKSREFNKLSNCEKSGDHSGSHVEEIIAWHSGSDQRHSLSDSSTESQSAMEEVTEVASTRVTIELENRREREATSKAKVLSTSESAPKYDRHYEKGIMDSHVRMGAEFQEKTEGLELAGKEIPVHKEDVCVNSSSKLAPKESITCFCKSTDSKFQKLNNNFKTRCGILQSAQDCSWPLCGDVTHGGFSESSFRHGQEIFFDDEDRSAMIVHNVQSGREIDSDVRQGNSFFEIDPISIPGPPGSFLPSPRDMRSEEFPGNSSLSSSWVHSCQDQHDLIDGDSSGSPISATSTISNSTASRSCLKYNNPPGPSDVFHDKLWSPSLNTGVLPFVENDIGLPHLTCTGAGRINGHTFNKVNKFTVERGPLSVITDGQPCCCQRGDRVSHGVSVNYQEPQLMRHQALASESMPAMGRKPTSYSLNTRPNSLDIMPEGFSPTDCRHSMSENMGFPAMKSPAKAYPLDGFPDRGWKIPRSGNCESAGPSTSNPVLRLMGKNLMVVNKDDEGTATPVKRPQPHPQHNHIHTQVPTFVGGSQNIQNQSFCSYSHWPEQDTLKDKKNAGNVLGQSLDVRLSKGFRNPAILNNSQPFVRGLFLKQQTDGGFRTSNGYKSDYNLHPHTNEALMNSAEASMYNTNRTVKIPDHQQINALSETNALKDSEGSLMANDPKYSGGFRTMQILTPGVSIPFTTSGSSAHVNSFSCYRAQDISPLDKPSSICNSNFQSVPTRQDHTSPVKWDCTSEAPYMCRRGVF